MAGAIVTVSGILGDKALLSVAGSPPRVMRVGESYQSIKLMEVQKDQVVVEEEGRRRTIPMGFSSSGASGGGGKKVVLHADGRGMFLAPGAVNGADVRFVLDTGASVVSIPKSVAVRAGVALDDGRRSRVSTAGGVVYGWSVKLNQVQVGDISIHMVDAVVLEDSHLSIALLGMSFLNRTNLSREGDLLTLSQRY